MDTEYTVDWNKIIYENGFWKIYKAHDKLGNPVAIKQICLENLKSQIDLEILKQNTELHQKIDSPYIVKLTKYFVQDNFFYVVMQYCQIDLQSALSLSKKQTNLKIVLGLFKKIFLSYLCMIQKGIVHRSLMPEKILIDRNNLKITDFINAASSNKTKMLIQAINQYSSPQIRLGYKYSYKTDIWSLGMILYRIYQNKLPWETQKYKELEQYSKCELKFEQKQGQNEEKQRRAIEKIIESCLKIKQQQRACPKQIASILIEYSQQCKYNKQLYTINLFVSIIYQQFRLIIFKLNPFLYNIMILLKKVLSLGFNQIEN